MENKWYHCVDIIVLNHFKSTLFSISFTKAYKSTIY